MKNKLEVLRKIAKELNRQNVTWAIGASVLLYFKGIVNEFHDIDIMFDEKDAKKIKHIFDHFGKHIVSPPNEMFKTKYFYEYIVDDIEIDCIGGFIVVKDGIDYDCSLKVEEITNHILLDDVDIPLYSLDKWKYFYFLINRSSKVKMIEDYYKNKNNV